SASSPLSVADEFTYYAAAPVVTAVSPNVGTTGTTVTISGTNFSGETLVSFGTQPATVSASSNTSLTVTAPTGSATSVVNVTVTGPGGTSSVNSSDTFTYGPVVTAVAPNSGSHLGGTAVTIRGGGFTGATAVDFGATPVTSPI